MSRVLIFDVDGTLAASGQPLDPAFSKFLMSFWPTQSVYIVTGSDYAKLEKQFPKELLNSAKGVFTCSANEFRQGDETVYLMQHIFPAELVGFCMQLISQSDFGTRCGNHIEHRNGLLNASVVGREANREARRHYSEFDMVMKERVHLINAINTAFPDYEACMGGQISINISPAGWNKSRVYRELRRNHPSEAFHFFADGISKFGNDVPLARALESAGHDHKIYKVRDYKHTWEILKETLYADFSSKVAS